MLSPPLSSKSINFCRACQSLSRILSKFRRIYLIIFPSYRINQWIPLKRGSYIGVVTVSYSSRRCHLCTQIIEILSITQFSIFLSSVRFWVISETAALIKSTIFALFIYFIQVCLRPRPNLILILSEGLERSTYTESFFQKQPQR